MTDRDPVGVALDALVPGFDDRADWQEVLRRTGRKRRSQRRLAAPALAVATALCAVLLLDPFGDDDGGVLDRALAAVGDGPVIHLVTQSVPSGELVHLESGRHSPLRVVRESWFDPTRGFRTSVRIGGAVLEEYAASADQPVRMHAADRALAVFTRDYREALDSGRARVIGDGTVAGTPVHWIRVENGRGPRQDVAVSRDTYEPVFVRIGPRRDAFRERVLGVESLPAGSGEIPGRVPRPDTLAGFRPLPRRHVDRGEARRLLGGRLIWPGTRVAGLGLTRVLAAGERPYRSSEPGEPVALAPPRRVIELLYDGEHGRLAINQARRPTYGLLTSPVRLPVRRTFVPLSYVPPRGFALLTAGGRRALVRRRGLVVVLAGSTPELVRAGLDALPAPR